MNSFYELYNPHKFNLDDFTATVYFLKIHDFEFGAERLILKTCLSADKTILSALAICKVKDPDTEKAVILTQLYLFDLKYQKEYLAKELLNGLLIPQEITLDKTTLQYDVCYLNYEIHEKKVLVFNTNHFDKDFVNSKNTLMPWNNENLDSRAFGIKLAEDVTIKLFSPPAFNQDLNEIYRIYGIFNSHRDYCGMGLFYSDALKCVVYTDIYDGGFYVNEEPQQLFKSQKDLINWLSHQSDLSLSDPYPGDQFYQNNQTLSRKRLLHWLQSS